MTYLFIILGLFVLTVAWLAIGIRRIGAVSKGKQISGRSKRALLLIDLQTVFWRDGPYCEDNKSKAQRAILHEIESARTKGDTVIALRQEWSIPSTVALARLTMKGQAIAGTAGTEIAAPFAGLADQTVTKRVQDGFETGALDQLLEEIEIGAMRVVGLDYNYCVLKTALAARSRGYDVSVIEAGVLAAADKSDAAKRLVSKGVELI